jgi:hypothetical protein
MACENGRIAHTAGSDSMSRPINYQILHFDHGYTKGYQSRDPRRHQRGLRMADLGTNALPGRHDIGTGGVQGCGDGTPGGSWQETAV